MPKKHRQYKNESLRLQAWDYSWQGAYFVTLVTEHRVPYFGQVIDKKMYLSAIGEIVEIEWEKSKVLRPDMNLYLGEYQVMPDHFHAILHIGRNPYNRNPYNRNPWPDKETPDRTDALQGVPKEEEPEKPTPDRTDALQGVPKEEEPEEPIPDRTDALQGVPKEEEPEEPTPDRKDALQGVPSKNSFGPQRKNLASIIRGFKGAVTREARKIDPAFAWQPRYHEHIIRDDRAYRNIAHYVKENPKKWTH